MRKPYKYDTPERRKKHAENQKKWRLRHPEAVYDSSVRRRERLRAYVWKFKDVPCADCGQRYPHYVMDFDHLPGAEKLFGIAYYVASRPRQNLKELAVEIAKCEVVCANCHRIRSHIRRAAEAEAKRKLRLAA